MNATKRIIDLAKQKMTGIRHDLNDLIQVSPSQYENSERGFKMFLLDIQQCTISAVGVFPKAGQSLQTSDLSVT